MTTKVHALVDVIGRPFAIALTAGNVADIRAMPLLLPHLRKTMRYLIADKGYDANELRRDLREHRITPVTPGRSNRSEPIRYDKRRCRDRHLIENAFCRLKEPKDRAATSTASQRATISSPETSCPPSHSPQP